MSKDARYILSYEYQDYVHPTPQMLDKGLVNGITGGVAIKELDHGYTLHFEMPKYDLSREIVSKLKADKVFIAYDGDPYSLLDR